MCPRTISAQPHRMAGHYAISEGKERGQASAEAYHCVINGAYNKRKPKDTSITEIILINANTHQNKPSNWNRLKIYNVLIKIGSALIVILYRGISPHKI